MTTAWKARHYDRKPDVGGGSRVCDSSVSLAYGRSTIGLPETCAPDVTPMMTPDDPPPATRSKQKYCGCAPKSPGSSSNGTMPRGHLRPPGAGSLFARRIIAIVLVVLTAVLACATVPALFLRSEVLDTDRYVATVAPLASDPAIQAEIANKVTTQITEAVDIEGITRDAMTELGNVAPRVCRRDHRAGTGDCRADQNA